MAVALSNTFVNKLLGTSTTAGVAEQLAGGSLVLYSGTAPDGPNEALGQHATNTALATFTFSAIGSWSAAGTAGVENLQFSATTVTVSAAGTATFWRMLDSGGNALIQGNISGDGVSFSSTTFASGDNVTITGTPTISWATV